MTDVVKKIIETNSHSVQIGGVLLRVLLLLEKQYTDDTPREGGT